jgi:hypothetical protein
MYLSVHRHLGSLAPSRRKSKLRFGVVNRSRCDGACDWSQHRSICFDTFLRATAAITCERHALSL